MGFSILNIGVTGVNAAQFGLVTTEHNIVNANTPGYHRQEAQQTTQSPQFTGAGWLGQGVTVATVRRVYNEFLDTQVMTADAQFNQLKSAQVQIGQIDNMLADTSSGLSPALQSFFSSVNDLAAHPESMSSRQAMKSSAEALVTRFTTINTRFREMRDGINGQIRTAVSDINSYAAKIALLNQQIATAAGSDTQPPNDLYDQREQTINELNQLIGVSVVKQDGDQVNVFIGGGQPLVIGRDYLTMTATMAADDPERMDVGLKTQGGTIPFTSSTLQGGTLGGLIATRGETLDPAQNALGRVAIGLAQTFNDLHRLGLDLTGALGGDFFTVPTPKIVAATTNAGAITIGATITDVGQLTTSDYQLVSGGGGNYSLTRLSDGVVMFSGVTLPRTVDGFQITASAAAPAGDFWQIQPTRNGARDIAVSLADARNIAAAAPIRTGSGLNNTGTAKISTGTVNSYNDNVTITFTGAATFNVVDTTTGATLATGAPYVAGNNIDYNGWRIQIAGVPNVGDSFVVDHHNTSATATNAGTGTVSVAVPTPPNTAFGPDPNVQAAVTITFTSATTFNVAGAVAGLPVAGLTYTAGGNISYNGWNVQITGTPGTGDTFTVGANSNGLVDNRNALLLAGLQSTNTLGGSSTASPTVSYQGAYSQLVADVGIKAREIEITSKSQEALLSQTKAAQQSFSGVNLDEEAANLMRYQQAYQASGKIIQIAATLFDTLLSLGR